MFVYFNYNCMVYTLLGNPIDTTYILSFKSYNTKHDDGMEENKMIPQLFIKY